MIGRHYRARVADWGHERALTVFRRLLERERGAFWTFCIFTGDRYLIGASPERHVSVEDGQVRMNPISGTFRMRGLETHADRKRELLRFLADEKEIYELFMVVDEELKMMCDICHEGGLVLGPYLKPMSHLVHTEYLLAGRTRRDVREVLRDSMFAATVTGSPVENACRLIKQVRAAGPRLLRVGRRPHRPRRRRHCRWPTRPSSSAPPTSTSTATSRSPPAPRSCATPTRRTRPRRRGPRRPASSARSVWSTRRPEPVEGFDAFTREEDVLIALGSRNQRLSQFWLTDQSGTPPVPSLVGKRVVVLDGEDDFVNMLSHVFGVLGMTTDVVRHDALRPTARSTATTSWSSGPDRAIRATSTTPRSR